MDFTHLQEKAKEYLPPEKLALVEAAYQFAVKAHEGQVRKSGEPYLEHPLATAITLVDLQLDAASIAAALLHDVLEDCVVTPDEIKDRFGDEVSELVVAATKLSKLSWETASGDAIAKQGGAKKELQAENLRKMLVAMAEDLRVVFIKLADRLHNMHTLAALPPEKRRKIAQETLEIYAPLAHRLGMWGVKWQLEDLSFRYVEPRRYHQVARLVASRRAQRESFIAEVTRVLKEELERAKVEAEVSGRPKHIYSIHQKMERYAAQGKDFSDIHDLLALRVLVDTVSDCYQALGVIHNLWHPLPEEFNDLIANPKDNGYQALHTTVLYKGVTPLEIQIRTHEMHHIAEYGVAAHWKYKGGDGKVMHLDERISWLRQLSEWQKELSGEEFLESVKTDIFIDQVLVYTPKGEIKELPKGATPLDFAYRIHTDLGHRCIGAKVNGKLVPLNYQLRNADVVEILASKGTKGPSLDWLNPDLGYIKTAHARGKIRQWFKKRERAENIARGRQLLEKEMKRLGVSIGNLEEVARLFKYESAEEFFAALGYGGITPHQVALKVVVQEEQPRLVAEKVTPGMVTPSSIQVLGVGDLLTHLARCCHPLPGDDIIGYITRNRGVTAHRRDCHNIVHEANKERLVEVTWGHVSQLYPISIQVEAWDRVGLLRDISTIVAEEKINIAGVNVAEHSDHTTTLSFTLEVRSMAQLTRLMSKVEGIPAVISASRQRG